MFSVSFNAIRCAEEQVFIQSTRTARQSPLLSLTGGCRRPRTPRPRRAARAPQLLARMAAVARLEEALAGAAAGRHQFLSGLLHNLAKILAPERAPPDAFAGLEAAGLGPGGATLARCAPPDRTRGAGSELLGRGRALLGWPGDATALPAVARSCTSLQPASALKGWIVCAASPWLRARRSSAHGVVWCAHCVFTWWITGCPRLRQLRARACAARAPAGLALDVSDAAQRLGSAALGYEDSPTRPPGAGAPVNYLAAMLTYLAKVRAALGGPRQALLAVATQDCCVLKGHQECRLGLLECD